MSILNIHGEENRFFFGRFSEQNEIKTAEGKVGIAGYSTKGLINKIKLFFAEMFKKTIQVSDNGVVYHLNKASLKKWIEKSNDPRSLELLRQGIDIIKIAKAMVVKTDQYNFNEVLDLLAPEDSEILCERLLQRKTDDEISNLSQDSIIQLLRKFPNEGRHLLPGLTPDQRREFDVSVLDDGTFLEFVSTRTHSPFGGYGGARIDPAKVKDLSPRQLEYALDHFNSYFPDAWRQHISIDQLQHIDIDKLSNSNLEVIFNEHCDEGQVQALTAQQVETLLNKCDLRNLEEKLSAKQISELEIYTFSNEKLNAFFSIYNPRLVFRARALTDVQVNQIQQRDLYLHAVIVRQRG